MGNMFLIPGQAVQERQANSVEFKEKHLVKKLLPDKTNGNFFLLFVALSLLTKVSKNIESKSIKKTRKLTQLFMFCDLKP